MLVKESLVAEMKSWRHAMHACPETAFEEILTARLIASVLRGNGITVHEGVGRTGVVGTLQRGEGPSIGLRADMDALPMEEKNTFAYKSVHMGKMHACGHDGHSAMLLGAAVALTRDTQWHGTVRFIFQPAEEDGGGARVMIEDGLFERFPCDAVYGLHNWPGLPLGRFALKSGPIMASADTFEIIVQGKGAHAAMPDQGIDSLVCASHIVLAIQSIVSRRLPPMESAVVSVTQVHGGDAWNVLPDVAIIRGSVRCFSSDAQGKIRELLEQISRDAATAQGAAATVSYRYGYPAAINSVAETAIAVRAAATVVGDEHVDGDCTPTMGSEDFAFMLDQRPGAYIWMGVDRNETTIHLHNPHYDFNDEALAIGASYWVALVRSVCRK
jgi:amidohydrolase